MLKIFSSKCVKIIYANDYRKDLMENSGLKEGVVYKVTRQEG
jgi:hypothetical protein